MAPIALVAPMARSTNRSTAAAPDSLVLLLCVTSPAVPGPHPAEPGPTDTSRNITNRGISARPRRPDARLAARRASIVA